VSSRTAAVVVERLGARIAPADVDELVSLFIECVDGGASMGYLAPLSVPEAAEFWLRIIGDLSDGQRILVVARDAPGGRIVGSAQVDLEARPNGRHRAEVQKVMVRPAHRRRGLGTMLMGHLEAAARERGVRLLFLDTSEGPGGARELYERLDYMYAGGIPGWALDPDGTPAKNAIFYKLLD
jgi:acetyltransferase